MSSAPTLIFDFDSTLVGFETLEVLAELALEGAPEAASIRAEIAALTDQAMSGALGFDEALTRRLTLLPLTRAHVQALAEQAVARLAPSVARNVETLRAHAGQLVIVSGGLREVIAPVARHLGVPDARVLANDLTYDDAGRVSGVDRGNPLSADGGKVTAIRALNLSGPVVMIGDGWTDAEVRLAGLADRFHAFCEVVRRPRVVEAADSVVVSLDEVLHAEGLIGRWSYPRSRIKVLLLESVHPAAVAALEGAGYSVECETGALDEDALIARVKGVHVLGLRSKTGVSERVIDAADRLMAVGAFCIGTNHIDLDAASRRGIAVFNAPYSNTRSVVELAIGLVIALLRGVVDRSAAMHEGRWNKSARGSRELRGKTLGIVGYGAIGSQLSVLAEALGMRVVYHDLSERLALGNARPTMTLAELLAEADVVSLHVDGRAGNHRLIGAAELARMKPGAVLINLSRGHVVDIDALAEVMRAGRLGGAAIDVFPEEPRTNQDPFDSPLRGLANVIMTPHVGGSTEEAQEAIGAFAASRLLGYLNRGDTTFCVNLPNVQLSDVQGAHRLLHIHQNQPGVLAALNQALSAAGLNILGQHLKTDGRTGYVITDVDRDYQAGALDSLKSVPGTLRFRSLY